VARGDAWEITLAIGWRELIHPARLAQEKETSKLLDFFSKYDDDADDSKYYSTSQVRWDGQREWRPCDVGVRMRNMFGVP
jgi:hypothetical protein